MADKKFHFDRCPKPQIDALTRVREQNGQHPTYPFIQAEGTKLAKKSGLYDILQSGVSLTYNYKWFLNVRLPAWKAGCRRIATCLV